MNDMIYRILIIFILICSPCVVIGSILTGEIIDGLWLFCIITLAEIIYISYKIYSNNTKVIQMVFDKVRYSCHKYRKVFLEICVILFVVIGIYNYNLASTAESNKREKNRITEYINSYNINFLYDVPYNIHSDNETYSAIYELCCQYIVVYDKMDRDLSKEGIINELALDGDSDAVTSYPFDDILNKFEKTDEIMRIFNKYLEAIIDASSDDFICQKEELLDYFDNYTFFIMRCMEDDLDNNFGNYFEDALDLDYPVDSRDNDALICKMYYTMYPEKILDACEKFIDETSNCYEWLANDRISQINDFLKSIDNQDKFASQISNVMENVKNAEITVNDLPYIGMQVSSLKNTALGEPDEIQLSADYYGMVPRARHKKYIWYDINTNIKCAEAFVQDWDYENQITVPNYISNISFFGKYAKFNNKSRR